MLKVNARACIWDGGAAFLALLLATTSPAVAQIPTSSSEIVGIPDAKDYIDGARELKRVSGCAIRLNSSYAKSMVNSLPGSTVEGRVGRALMRVMEHCLTDVRPAMGIGFAQLRGSLAEEFYLNANPQAPHFELIDHTSMALPKEWIGVKAEGYTASELVAHDLAQCVVAAAPEQADKLLRTFPRSREEGLAITQLQPVLGPCLIQGYKFQMDAAAVRSYLAQALYRGMALWPVKSPSPVQSTSGKN